MERQLHRHGQHTYLINDQTFLGLNSDLDSATSQQEIVRRAAEVARLMVDAGLVVLIALDSAESDMRGIRSSFKENTLIEIRLGGRSAASGETENYSLSTENSFRQKRWRIRWLKSCVNWKQSRRAATRFLILIFKEGKNLLPLNAEQ